MRRAVLLVCALSLGSACSSSNDRKCGDGTVRQGNACVAVHCDDGYVLQGSTCVAVVCDAGYVREGTTCVDVDECNAAVTFRKASYEDAQDCITPEVCLTRGDRFPLYNSVVETLTESPSCSDSPVPTGTLWARGTCASVTDADFGPFLSDAFAACGPPRIVDVPGCLKIGDRYFDITFDAWGAADSGGSFSYTRTEAICGVGALCNNTPGGHTCSCPSGYAMQDGRCVDVDECAAGTDACDPSATCENLVGGYRCACPGEVAFTKSNYGAEQDCITDGVCLTRGDQYPLYNAVVDAKPTSGVDCTTSALPTGTRWALGACAEARSSQFGTFLGNHFASCSPQSVVGVPGCLRIGDLAFDITFQSWTGGNQGGGFSYTRSNVVPPGTACPATPPT